MAESCVVELESKYQKEEEAYSSDDCEVCVANMSEAHEKTVFGAEINDKKSRILDDEIENEILSDDEYNYSDDSVCFEDSEMTNITPRSSLCIDSPLNRRMSLDESAECFNEINPDDETSFPRQLPDNIRDNIRRMCSSANNNRNVARLDPMNFRAPRKNMSFTNAEMRRIEVENQYLLKKIMAHQRPQNKSIRPQTSQPRISSSAINRRKLQKQIEGENMMLLRRIQEAKSCALSPNVTPGYRLTAL